MFTPTNDENPPANQLPIPDQDLPSSSSRIFPDQNEFEISYGQNLPSLDQSDFSTQSNFSSFENETRMDSDLLSMRNKLNESLTEVDQNPVISLAMEHVKRDIEVACQLLKISANPVDWNFNDVIKWLKWATQEYNVPLNMPLENWIFDGKSIVQLNEEYFKEKIPKGGDLVFAQLEIWKSNATVHQIPSNKESTESNPPINFVESLPTQPSQSGSRSSQEFFREGVIQETIPAVIRSSNVRPHRAQLWQFLKELLSKPQIYHSLIRWVDQEEGIFRFVDSARVAKMWGERKNRPAMNFDKLSRSLRQYYQKGIMKKTDRTQRLVYQFCPPFHL